MEGRRFVLFLFVDRSVQPLESSIELTDLFWFASVSTVIDDDVPVADAVVQ